MSAVNLAIPDCHNPRNLACGHNGNPSLACECRRVKVRRNYRVCRVTDRHAPNGIEPEIVLEVHPGGLLVFREKGRRMRYETTAGKVFAGIVWREAMASAAAKKKKKGTK